MKNILSVRTRLLGADEPGKRTATSSLTFLPNAENQTKHNIRGQQVKEDEWANVHCEATKLLVDEVYVRVPFI